MFFNKEVLKLTDRIFAIYCEFAKYCEDCYLNKYKKNLWLLDRVGFINSQFFHLGSQSTFF